MSLKCNKPFRGPAGCPDYADAWFLSGLRHGFCLLPAMFYACGFPARFINLFSLLKPGRGLKAGCYMYFRKASSLNYNY